MVRSESAWELEQALVNTKKERKSTVLEDNASLLSENEIQTSRKPHDSADDSQVKMNSLVEPKVTRKIEEMVDV